MVFRHRSKAGATDALMSVFADDLLIVCETRMKDAMRRTLDGEMKVVWGQILEEGAGWIRYLGKEWI
eukprot:10625593-Heterocapsa_arctica.AAC.1